MGLTERAAVPLSPSFLIGFLFFSRSPSAQSSSTYNHRSCRPFLLFPPLSPQVPAPVSKIRRTAQSARRTPCSGNDKRGYRSTHRRRLILFFSLPSNRSVGKTHHIRRKTALFPIFQLFHVVNNLFSAKLHIFRCIAGSFKHFRRVSLCMASLERYFMYTFGRIWMFRRCLSDKKKQPEVVPAAFVFRQLTVIVISCAALPAAMV